MRTLIAALNELWTGIIAALNSFSTAWIAIIVIVIGMYFALQANKAGLPSDIASGVIGAGIGLLTGQAIKSHKDSQQQDPTQSNPPTPPEK